MTPLELIAHDIICTVKYGSTGGSANNADVKKVADYLASLPEFAALRPVPQVRIAVPHVPKLVGLPTVAAPKLSVEAVCSQFKVTLPGTGT